MPILDQLLQRKHQAGFDARGVIGSQPQRLGDAVSGFETHPEDIPRQAVRIGLHHMHGLVAVLLVDLDRQVGADPIRVQEEHDLFDLALLLPGLGDHAHPLGTDVRDLLQALRLVFDHLQGGCAEVSDDALGKPRPNATHQSRAQVAADAGDGCRQSLLAHLYLELQAVFRVGDPLPFK